MSTTGDFITTTEAARILGVSPTTVRAMIRRDELPAEFWDATRFILKRDVVEAKARGRK
jgi:excisionase family DNA binding protein